jgi:hypothetical protein
MTARLALAVVGLLGACKASPAPTIPGATIERWTEALRAVCSEVRPLPRSDGVPEPATAKLPILCKPKPEYEPWADDAGGDIQLDASDRPIRIAFDAQVSDEQTLALAERLLRAYRLPDAAVRDLLAQHGSSRETRVDGAHVRVVFQHRPGRAPQGKSEVFDVNIVLDPW